MLLLLCGAPSPALPSSQPLLEDLAERYAGTDKARDDHKFVDLYAMLLDPIREGVRNVTEVGIAYGLSVEMWYDYFPRADIWGIDIGLAPIVRKRMRPRQPRAHLLVADSTNCTSVGALHFADESMDIIIDDGPHWADANEVLLSCLWRTLKPGGFYFVEDVLTGNGADRLQRKFEAGAAVPAAKSGLAALVHYPEQQSTAVRAILEGHDCFFADTAVGHRAWERYRRATPTATVDRANHNSHVLVIRKRADGSARTRPVLVHSDRMAKKTERLKHKSSGVHGRARAQSQG